MRPLLMLWGCLVLPGYGSVVDPKEISGFEGDTVSLQCTYEEQLKKNQKYWCREAGLFISRCTGTVFSGEYGQEGRVSVHDNPQENRFTVILRNLTLKDMGKYWCGVKRLGFDKTMSVSLLVFPGISQPATQLDSTSTQDTSFVPSSSSKSRVSIPLIRILAPVLVLLALLLATGLAALGNYMFQRREKAQLASETQKKDKIHLSHLALGNSWVPESAVIKLAEPTGPPASPEPSASSNTEIWCLSQTSEDDEASWRDPKGDMTPASTLPMSGDEPGFSKFSSV
ncbi:CMRF35-like molecule 9 isoform X3 [Bubalus kerabau]|uniref:CMRF35-like molecule 9 isoform X11 n=1 Tax=Bubalus bubalis TaxID=89462 RepID=UPI00042CD246|nr:CMRF35-like molecule 9 isoform X11 [Bubalus bubalis]XP_055431731.1 CMRF35-like molecule 9 isoform X3 [Bubalus carabanensis]